MPNYSDDQLINIITSRGKKKQPILQGHPNLDKHELEINFYGSIS